MEDINLEVIYEFFETLNIDHESSLDIEDEEQISWIINYHQDTVHIIVEKNPQFVDFPVLSFVSPVFELDKKEIDSIEKLSEVYEDLLDYNFNLFQMSVAAYDNLVFLVYKNRLSDIGIDDMFEKIKFFVAQKRRIEESIG